MPRTQKSMKRVRSRSRSVSPESSTGVAVAGVDGVAVQPVRSRRSARACLKEALVKVQTREPEVEPEPGLRVVRFRLNSPSVTPELSTSACDIEAVQPASSPRRADKDTLQCLEPEVEPEPRLRLVRFRLHSRSVTPEPSPSACGSEAVQSTSSPRRADKDALRNLEPEVEPEPQLRYMTHVGLDWIPSCSSESSAVEPLHRRRHDLELSIQHALNNSAVHSNWKNGIRVHVLLINRLINSFLNGQLCQIVAELFSPFTAPPNIDMMNHHFVNVTRLELAAVCDLDPEEMDTAVEDNYGHVQQWVSELESPGTPEAISRSCRTSDSEGDMDTIGTESVQVDDLSQPEPSGVQVESMSTTEPMDVQPSKSGRTVKSLRRTTGRVTDGSEFDSDFDDEFDPDEIVASGGMVRDIPDDEELDEPVRNIVTAVETAMDDAIDQLIGLSSDFNWSEDFDRFQGVPEIFSGPTPGPIKDYETPYDAFTDIWGQDIMELIARETNRYAQQVIDEKAKAGTLSDASRLRDWTDTNVDEMYVLFAVYMFMGLDPRTSVHEFWQSTGYLEMPKFRQVMSYNRFILLNKFIHFVDNSDLNRDSSQSGGIVTSAKLRKIASVVGHLNVKFQELYNLHPNLAIDESLTLFKGRLSWIQAVRTKAARFGIKSFELCESRTGYLYRFEIYTGKNSEEGHFKAPTAELACKSTQVVMDLLNGLERRGHCVTMDNFYNCPALARYLKSLGFDCLGTLRPSRKNVPEFRENVPKGTIEARHCGDVSCIAWKDTKLVTMISTYHNAETYVGRKAGKVLVKPVVVKDYNSTMGGVDLKDQKLSMYLMERKRCLKWYMKIFKRLLNVSLHNAFILLLGSRSRRNMPPMTHRAFRVQLANSLVDAHRRAPPQRAAQQRPEPSSDSSSEIMRLRKDVVHVPKHLIHSQRRQCHICARKGTRKLVRLQCATCDVCMCHESCWLEWHSLKDLPGKDILVRKGRKQSQPT